MARINYLTNPNYETGTSSLATGVGFFGFNNTLLNTYLDSSISYLGKYSQGFSYQFSSADSEGVVYVVVGTTPVASFAVGNHASSSIFVVGNIPSGIQICTNFMPCNTTGKISSGIVESSPVTSVPEWTKLTANIGSCPADTDHVRLEIAIEAINGSVLSDFSGAMISLCFDCACIEKSVSVGTYFDGSYGGIWSGLADSSISTQSAAAITLLSPSSGNEGIGLAITGLGFGLRTLASSVTIGGIKANIESWSEPSPASTIVAIVPTLAAGAYPVIVSPSGDGSGTNSAASTFTVTTVAPVPTISSIAPSSGEFSDSMTVTGTGFTGATSVNFNGVSASFSVSSSTSITAIVPKAATTGHVTVVTPGGTATSASTFTVLMPNISSISPTSGLVGASVTLTGANFLGVTSVLFGSKAATFVIYSATSIVAKVPTGASSGPVYASGASGSGTGPTFTVSTAVPVVASLLPNSGVGGTAVTITGTSLTGATSVSFNGQSSAYAVVSDTTITTTVPARATTGVVKVGNSNGTGTGPVFTVPSPANITFSPSSGLAGTAVTISGNYFTGATSVDFGVGVTGSFIIISDNIINLTVPINAVTGKVTVVTPAGSGTSSSTFTVTPQSLGHPFSECTTAATTLVARSIQELMAAPSGETLFEKKVYYFDGTSLQSVALAGVSVQYPSISSFSPVLGVAGTVVTIIGSGFTGASVVTFGGITSAYTVVSTASITAAVPASAQSGPITVTTPGGTAVSPTSFSVPVPVVSGFYDSSTLSTTTTTAGDSVVVNGQYFTGTSNVVLNSTVCSFTMDNASPDGKLSFVVPAGASTGLIAVTTPGGTATAGPITVSSVGGAPTVVGVTPTSGAIGQAITVSGTNLSGVTHVNVGSTYCSGMTYNSGPGTLTATVAAGTVSGVVKVFAPAGSAAGSTFTVTNSTATITAVSPSSCVGGSTSISTITVTGTNLSGVSAGTVGGVAISGGFSNNTATSVQFQMPVTGAGGAISLTCTAGIATGGSCTVPVPVITSFTPTTGIAGS